MNNILNKSQQKPNEDYVEIRIPKSTYKLFNAAYDHEIIEPSERHKEYSRRTRTINSDLYQRPESYIQKEEARGILKEGTLEDSLFYPGTKHQYWTYTSKYLNNNDDVPLLVFLDGQFMMRSQDDKRPEILNLIDNLEKEGSIKPCVCAFLAFGVPGPGQPVMGFREGEVNRSFEYDMTSDWHARFLVEEYLPFVLKDQPVSDNPHDHYICGISSSGLAAFSVAWFRSDFFGNVFGASPSFANIRSGIIWPSVLRLSDQKDIRIFNVVGRHDCDNLFGNWLANNYALACALYYKNYDPRYYVSEGGHSFDVYYYMLPYGLKWLFSKIDEEIPNVERLTYPEMLL